MMREIESLRRGRWGGLLGDPTGERFRRKERDVPSSSWSER